MRKTKTICTIGPSTSSIDQIMHLIQQGMNVARINLSHSSYQEHADIITRIKKARKQLGASVAIMVDTRGQKVRLQTIKDGKMAVSQNQMLTLCKTQASATDTDLAIYPSSIFDHIQENMSVFFDDGYVTAKVKSVMPDRITVQILNAGVLKSHKGIIIPGAQDHLDFITAEDEQDLLFACNHHVDWIAASFIQSANHLIRIRSFVHQNTTHDIRIMAKIESMQAICKINEIFQEADAVMVARGDLGLEISLENVPAVQKMIARKSQEAQTPTVIATQMLESMIEHILPTRAEVSDIANGVYEDHCALMLSAETATGKFPFEAVKMMHTVIVATEKQKQLPPEEVNYSQLMIKSTFHPVALEAVTRRHAPSIKALVVMTLTGDEARHLSYLRPQLPIIAVVMSETIYHQLALEWGVQALLMHSQASFEEVLTGVMEYGVKNSLFKANDQIITVTSPSSLWNEIHHWQLIEHDVLFVD